MSEKTSSSKLKLFTVTALGAILAASFFALSLQSRPAFGTFYTLNSSTCTTTFSGTWSTNNCSTSASVFLGKGDTLTIPAGTTLTLLSHTGTGALPLNNGTIINNGTIAVSSGAYLYNDGIIDNYRTISITPAGSTTPSGNVVNLVGSIFDFCAGDRTSTNGVVTNINLVQGHVPQLGCTTITLSQSAVQVGAVVRVTGVYFGHNSPLSIQLRSSLSTITLGSVTTNSSGSFSTSVTIPRTGNGVYNIVATSTTPTHSIANAQILVIPALGSNPGSAIVGNNIFINGTGFVSNSNLLVTLDGGVLTTTPSLVATDRNGSFNASLIVPPSTAGNHYVLVQDSASTLSRQLRIVPSIALTPTSGAHNATVSVKGTGFAASSTVTITIGTLRLTTSPPTVVTDSTGSFSATFVVPSNAVAGSYFIRALDGSGNSARSTFTVTAG
ncbi:MAG: hypothetical protein ABI361_03965 [Nitrososphaera sp.]